MKRRIVTLVAAGRDRPRAGRLVRARGVLLAPLAFLVAASSMASGALDTLFGASGRVVSDLGSSGDVATAVALQPDGKVVAAGYTDEGRFNRDFALVRYGANGSLDASFDGDGKVIVRLGVGHDVATAVAVRPNGKVVVGGYSLTTSSFDFALVRLNANGSLDPSFSGDGKASADFGSRDDYANALAVGPDGKVVLAGKTSTRATSDFALARLTPGGFLDPTFSGDGKLSTDLGSSGDEATAVALQPDGKVVVAGYTDTGSKRDFALVRLTAGGSLDPSFSGDGRLTIDLGTAGDRANAVAVQPDGKIVVAGLTSAGSSGDFALVRLTANGSLDPSFSGDGKASVSFGRAGDEATGLAVGPRGQVVAAGQAFIGSGYDFALARFGADGSLDATFGTNGRTVSAFGPSSDGATAVAVQPDGKVVAVGYADTDAGSDFALARYRP